MREILFRGKTINSGKWIEGYLFENWGDAYICWGTENGNIMKKKVDEVTAGQYTGLKDKNGTEIYEGDIVKSYAGIFASPVEWNASYCGFYPFCAENTSFHVDECEIIGNIYKNPELLKWF